MADRAIITIEVAYTLAPGEQRHAIYGQTDALVCAAIDATNDPVDIIEVGDSVRVVGVRVASEDDGDG